MSTYRLTEAERTLFDAIQHGDPAKYKKHEVRKIRAVIIRHFVLGLPVIEEGGFLRTTGALLGVIDGEKACRVTGAGISIEGAVITGRLELDAAISEEGGPICPLAFTHCEFKPEDPTESDADSAADVPATGADLSAGFSGAHGHFARLSFRDCTFGNYGTSLDPTSKRPLPTINLSGAGVDGGLDMRGIRPENEKDLLWIRAPGIRIDGEIDLSRCLLRAPGPCPPGAPRRLMCEEADDALNLMLAEIKGDLQFLNGSKSIGRIKLRGARIGGDVWMSGATLESNGQGEALFLQSARIGGFLMMDGRWERAEEQGRFLEFRCSGELNLTAAEIGRDVHLEDALVIGPVEAAGLNVRDDFVLGADVAGNINLSGCRIGGSLDLSDLNCTSSVKSISLKDGNIGRSLKLVSSHCDYELVTVHSRPLKFLKDTELLESLWSQREEGKRGEATGKEPRCDEGSNDETRMDRRLVGAAFLRHRGSFVHLDGHADIEGRMSRWFKGGIRKKARRELRHLLRVYSPGRHLDAKPELRSVGCADGDESGGSLGLGQTASSPVAPFRFRGGLILPPRLPRNKLAALVREREWIADRCPRWRKVNLSARLNSLRSYVQSKALLQGEIDLENLTCDMLDDQAGRGWSTHLDTIRMNHFTYGRTTWEPMDLKKRWGLSTRPIKSFRKRFRILWKLSRHPAKSLSDLATGVLSKWLNHLWSWLKRLTAERVPVWAAWLFNWSDRLRVGEHWTSIEKKRNWIYRQFDTAGLSSSSKYRVRSSEYRSQPLEQVVKVARAEGREDYALYFEILKQRIEWDIFTSRNRGWFFLLGLVVSLLWASWGNGVRLTTVVLVTILFTLLPSLANWVMYRGFGYLRRPIRAICTLIAAFLIGWWAVSVANDRGMLVIELAPIASVVAEGSGTDTAAVRLGGAALGQAIESPAPSDLSANPIIGAPRAPPNTQIINLRCGKTVNEALYALDILIPLIDLREESRCGVGRATGVQSEANRFERLFFEDATTFWEVMKALYAIAGWFIISLAILTFAHVTRQRADAP